MPRLAKTGRVRIIGGKWRGRKLRVAAGVRPTPDRVRETVFNWLAPTLPGARVLDLFAGTGALAFEALSRGAQTATLVESNRGAARLLERHRAMLQAPAAVVQGDALQWLAAAPAPSWDVAFLDPPFGTGLLAGALPGVAQRLAAGGALYVETDARFELAQAERLTGLTVRREHAAGAVRCALLER